MVPAGANQDLEELIAVSGLAPMIAEMQDGATMEPAFAIPNMLELIAKFIKKMFTFLLSVLSTVSTDVLESVLMFTRMMVLGHPVSATSNAPANVSQLVLVMMTRRVTEHSQQLNPPLSNHFKSKSHRLIA